jgi:hypothetical protein
MVGKSNYAQLDGELSGNEVSRWFASSLEHCADALSHPKGCEGQRRTFGGIEKELLRVEMSVIPLFCANQGCADSRGGTNDCTWR